jgi:hypothetical protein
LVNLSAMTIFLWHQTALMVTTATGLLAGRLPGLHTLPDGLDWVAARLMWLPVFMLVLAGCWAAFRSCEHSGGPRRSRLVRTHRPPTGAGTEGARHV